MSASFLAIDFETANYKSDSACAVGLVRVEKGTITDKTHYFIRPPYRNFAFTWVHGIKWSDVSKSPNFLELWPKILPWFDGIKTLVAHNMSFDRRVLSACCERYALELPVLDYECTVQLARKAWDLYPTNLPAVCKHLNIPLKHHEALSDAEACAKIAIAAMNSPR